MKEYKTSVFEGGYNFESTIRYHVTKGWAVFKIWIIDKVSSPCIVVTFVKNKEDE